VANASVYIARALSEQTFYYYSQDEPTGNLDTKTSEELWNFSMIFMKGNTVI
jgi:ABC-type ATPase involved in cell division